ncbi:hypothetical protein DVT68_09615 [Dyella solisilvae]|uniref:Uncharacterized protein n=1 Tax=Dyella solisilvae TaxID=1920168 RepID=A0A370K7Y5_9GAMM|nr:hypothetical protein [Dyella solisilvae]RDI98762.1 hypothetical protein DVT68_09615 [Dyella solisilvae]
MAAVLVALALQGCAETPAVLSRTEQQSLKAMKLFGEDASPRFTAYLSCTSEDESCATVNKLFSEWANKRQITLHLIEPDDTIFKGVAVSSSKAVSEPYRLAIQINTLLAPSFFQLRGGTYPIGGYYPPRVGYRGTVYVVDARTGAILQEFPVHHEITANPNDTANGYIQTVVGALIANLDPTYRISDR